MLERNLQNLHNEIATCERCSLHKHRIQVVDFDGNVRAKVAIVGDSPGNEEDACGIPFKGSDGKLLRKMLLKVGVNPSTDAFLINAVRCRPMGNATPSETNLEACRVWWLRQLSLVRPALIVTVGSVATSAILRRPVHILKERGVIRKFKFRSSIGERVETDLMPIFHPSYAIRNGIKVKRIFQSDLERILPYIK